MNERPQARAMPSDAPHDRDHLDDDLPHWVVAGGPPAIPMWLGGAERWLLDRSGTPISPRNGHAARPGDPAAMTNYPTALAYQSLHPDLAGPWFVPGQIGGIWFGALSLAGCLRDGVVVSAGAAELLDGLGQDAHVEVLGSDVMAVFIATAEIRGSFTVPAPQTERAWRLGDGTAVHVRFGHQRVKLSGAVLVANSLADAAPAPSTITFFADFAAATKREEVLNLNALAQRIRATDATTKAELPWLKLATFGDHRTERGSLRHNANVLTISGCEGDYDGEQIRFDTAVQLLTEAGLYALLYTSPSHSEDTPRWRVICPTSRERPPEQRERLLARVNGVLGGVLSGESWTLSQAYYYGSVNRNPSHQVVVIEGTCIDLADHLDAGAIGKPEKPRLNGDGRHGPATRPEDISDIRIRGLVDKLLDNVRSAADGTKHHTLFDIGRTLGGYCHLIGWSEAEAVEQLLGALPTSVADWDAARKTAAQAVALGATQPLELKDRRNPRTGRAADGALPDIDSGDDPPPPPADDPPPECDAGEPEADPLQAGINRLAALPELEFDRLDHNAEAERLGLDDAGILKRAVQRTRKAAEAQATAAAKAAEAAAKAAAKAEAAARKQSEIEAKAREKAARAEAKAREKEKKQEEAAAKKKGRPALQTNQDDGLGGWPSPDPNTLPEILVVPGERHVAADAGLAAMAAARVPFYQRGKDLVRVCLVRLKLSNGADVRAPAVSIVTRQMLMRALGRCATWHAYNKELDLVQIDPPADLGDHILGMIGEWPFPPLRGVIASQTMRYDGTLLTKPGYDAATGLVLFNPPPMPPIPDEPTKRDALDQLALLRDLLTEVVFADDQGVSLSGAVSMFMTPVLRGMMGVAPMHVVNKPVAGTGGSYLQDITAAIAIGERCPVISLTPNNDEENEKRLSSAALAGQPIIAIDNFTGTLMGDFLCQLIERPMPQVRLLGKSELVTITNNHCVLANGNNLTIGADTVRRTLQIALDANVENPETRTFSRNPMAEVLADRGRYIAACLTIARAYRLAGSPGRLPPRLSFEEWSDTVRSALVWLGWPDPDDSIKAVRAADPVSAKLHAVIAAWPAELIVGVGYYTSELVTLAGEYLTGANDRVRPMLWDALFAVAGNKIGQLDPRALGRWLEAHLNRVSAGHKLLVDRSNKARPRWSVAPL